MSFCTDISKYTISLIERELTNVRLDILEKLASYTGLTIPELFTKDFVKVVANVNEKERDSHREITLSKTNDDNKD